MTAYLLSGNDESVLRDETHELINKLVGDGDRGLIVDEYEGEEYELRELVDAAQTMPFLSDVRVVVGRGIDRFPSDDLGPLIDYLGSPLDTTHLVLVYGSGRIPKKLTDAIDGAGGHRVNTSPPSRPKERTTWVQAQASEHGVAIDTQAAARIADQIGDDGGRLGGIIDVLLATFGEGHRLRLGDIEPFIGAAGDVPPWDLTDAIDSGRTQDAIKLLHRMVHGGGRHPLQVMATLTNHFARLAHIDGADVRDEASAAAAMKIKPGFPAKKAFNNYRRLGPDGVRRAVDLLARADLDLRGDSGLPPETVMEILIARLSRL